MPQYDGYVRISTENDTSSAKRSTEELGNTIHDAMDTTPVDNMSKSTNSLENGIADIGDSALKTGDIIKANLVSEVITQSISKLGETLKDTALRTIEVADGLTAAAKKIAASTNASAGDTAKLKDAIETIYGDNFGESAEDIADSITKIQQNLGKLDDKRLVEITENALALRDVFDYDVAESSRAVKAMVNNFNISAAEAYDYIARGAQNGLDYSNELLDSISEYSVQFAKMGLSADDMFNIFANGAENGAWNLDKIGDSVKELAIRVIDGSDTSKQGFEALGFNADTMAEKFAEGGEKARTAFREVITALGDMNDPVAQNTAGINLMGTMWEDMGAQAVIALGNISDDVYECAGALDGIKDVNYNSLSNSIDNVKRQIDLLIQPIGESLIPALDETADTIAEVAKQGDLKEATEQIGEFASGTLSFLLKNIKLIGAAVTGVTTGVVAFKAASKITDIVVTWQKAALQVTLLGNAEGAAAVKTAALSGSLTTQEVIYGVLSGKLDAATAKQVMLNTAMSANPAGAIAAVIGVLAAALSGYAMTAGSAESASRKLTEAIDQMNEQIEKSIEDNDAEMAVLKNKASRYEELRSAVSLTADEHQELALLAQELQDTLGDEVSVVNKLTGEYNDLSDAVDDYVQKRSASVKLAAYENAAKEAYIAKDEAQKVLKEYFDKYANDGVWDINSAITAGFFEGLATPAKDIQAALDAIKEADDTIAEWQDLLSESYQDGITSSGDTLKSNFVLGSKYIAAEEMKKAGKESTENLAELYKQQRADAKYSYDMGVIDAQEYYAKLAVMRDKYLDVNSDEWRSVNVEIKKYTDELTASQKKAYEEAVKAQEQAAKEAAQARITAYNDEKNLLQYRQKTGQISEKKYYEELAKIRDKYLDKNTKEWRSAYLETYQYNQQIIQANKDALTQLLNDTTDSTLSALQNITSARDSLTAKLIDFNKTFEKITETVPETIAVKGDFTITTSEHEVETYKMGASSIEDNIKILEEYGNMLDALKARGADEDTLNSILGMDVEEGMEFGNELLKMSEKEWNGYFDSMAKLRSTAEDISARYYQSEVDSLRNNFIDKLREELFGLDSDMMSIGADAALSFVQGWNEALGSKDLTAGDMLYSLVGGTSMTAPKMAQLLSGFGMNMGSASEKQRGSDGKTVIPIYIGTTKLTDIFIEGVNSKNIKVGKNVLNT